MQQAQGDDSLMLNFLSAPLLSSAATAPYNIHEDVELIPRSSNCLDQRFNRNTRDTWKNYRVVVALLIKSTFSDILISELLLCSTKSRRPSSPVR
ncbi:hypothetical protein M404DRAFT_999338 [Pisolithus tinctorius Marx 270]|uniref:Uncharacterized protein n=1 Tax=Pisolithus tinctorius Marx 270 TaxID=870435 RepID=A0A0C3JAM3_PISTI|nr:hypothetical protein M404DRAFT_999338 [Pisolithus tinctorius Marx 270]